MQPPLVDPAFPPAVADELADGSEPLPGAVPRPRRSPQTAAYRLARMAELHAALEVESDQLVAELRQARWSWAEIARTAGISPQWAHHRWAVSGEPRSNAGRRRRHAA